MPPDPLSATFAALADPTRRAILARLASGEATVTELARPFDMSLPGVSKHLKVLRDAGLVVQGRDAQWRPCRLEPTALRPVAGWVDQYRALWEARFDRMDAYLRELQREEITDAGPEPDRERPADVDGQPHRYRGPHLDGGAPL